MSNLLRQIKGPGASLARWIGGQELTVLLSLLAIAVAVWGFIEITDEVLENDTQAFDKWVVRSVRRADDPATPVGPRWLQEMGRDLTAFGGICSLMLFTVVVAGYLTLIDKKRMAAFLVSASFSGLGVSLLLKQVFSRPRPDVVPHLSHVYTSSFPSGHSMLSAVVYLTLGSLVAAITPRPVIKIYVLAVAAFLTVGVGVSRVYLGVHYPTDVLAGWIAGLVWALLCWLIARWLQRRKAVEPAGVRVRDALTGRLRQAKDN